MIVDIAKILFAVGLLSSVFKILFIKKYNQITDSKKMIICNLHKASFALCIILGFIHGLTIVPVNQTYVLTGWLFGLTTIILMVLGVRMGFQNDWKPYNKEQNSQHGKIRLIKWILTILAVALLGMHYLL
ncbi:MAG: hypothetical protein ACFFAS_01950 [Promethearchaeota archaeon]